MANSLSWINAAYYQANGVIFNNGPYLARAAAFTGIVNTKIGILSFWLKCSGNDGVEQFLFRAAGGISQTSKTIANKLNMDFGQTPSGDLAFTSADSFLSDTQWHHFAGYWDATDSTKCGVVIDGVRSPLGGTVTNNPVNYGVTDWGVAANHVGGGPFSGSLADFYFNSNETLDLNVASNLAKFYSAGRPVYLGADGSIPTGNKPMMFLTGNAAAFPTNVGTGGGMTLHGVITDDPQGP